MGSVIPPEVIEEIKSRSDIVEVIGSFVQLKRAGNASFKGLCPFHQEKTPSFHVDGSRQMFHCFGCGKGGDVVRFVMDKENLSFVDAVHMLASRAGVVIPEYAGASSPEEARQRGSQRERLLALNEAMAAFFAENLRRDPQGPAAVYLRGRGLSPEDARRFRIGAAPDGWTAGLEFARSRGFTDKEMLAAGLARQKEGSARCYDQFRGRLTFAIANEHGRVCGFSARSLEAKPADGGKYINTPETPVFHKGHLLYGLAAARKAIAESGHAILCEGQMDTIAFHRAGVDCAVAPLGTAFTPDQAKILKRYTSRLLLAFDSDGAGQKAVERAAEILLPLSMDVRVISIPGGKDPDELFSTGGAEAVRGLVGTARPLMSVLASRLPGKFDLATPVGRGEAAAWMAGFLKHVENRVELEGYATEAAEALSVSVEAIYAELAGARRLERRREGFTQETRKTPAPAVRAEDRFVYPAALLSLLELAVNSDDAARRIAELVEPEELTSQDPVTRALNTILGAAVNGEFEQGIGEVRDALTDRPVPEISRILIEHTACPDTERAVSESVAEFRRIRRRDRKKELMEKLRHASSGEDKMKLLAEIAGLS
ncbi:MAG: DNA primase [Lentisphaeria bacterium]|nr:DNA primase [Lentisphaeria bacterium]